MDVRCNKPEFCFRAAFAFEGPLTPARTAMISEPQEAGSPQKGLKIEEQPGTTSTRRVFRLSQVQSRRNYDGQSGHRVAGSNRALYYGDGWNGRASCCSFTSLSPPPLSVSDSAMPDWGSQEEIAHDADAFGKLIHALFGVYLYVTISRNGFIIFRIR